MGHRGPPPWPPLRPGGRRCRLADGVWTRALPAGDAATIWRGLATACRLMDQSEGGRLITGAAPGARLYPRHNRGVDALDELAWFLLGAFTMAGLTLLSAGGWLLATWTWSRRSGN